VSPSDILEALADLLADRIAAKLGSTATPAYYDRDHLPPGAQSWRAVLDAARRGDLEAVRVGRKAVVAADAWASYLEGRRGRPRAPTARPELAAADADALAALGLAVPKLAAGGGRR
jgi:hypothetical protein